MKKKAEPIALQLARRIRLLREKKGLTQRELAQRSGVGDKYLQDWEGTMPHNAGILTLQKLAKGLGVPVWELLKFED
jgi:transcriptional regulator with XRE-family HTH domain